jgi:hypothetical protein
VLASGELLATLTPRDAENSELMAAAYFGR